MTIKPGALHKYAETLLERVQRQQQMIEKFKSLEAARIPDSMNFYKIPGLSTEVKEKLDKVQPLSLGQASRISGITPAAISILMVYMKKYEAGKADKKMFK